MTAPDSRVLQSSAFVRAAIPLAFASILLGLMLSGLFGGLFPPFLRPWAPVLLGAAIVALAIGGGLSIAFPRVVVDAHGALRVRGRSIAPSELVAVDRRLTTGSAAYLTYGLRTADGARVRLLAAGSPVRGMSPAQLELFREVVAASSLPIEADQAEIRRNVAGDGALASGRRVDIDRTHLDTELAALRGEPPVVAVATETAAERADLASDGVAAPGDGALSALVARADADDLAAAERLGRLPILPWVLRRIALVLVVLAVLATAVLLVVLVVMEANGTDFGAADEDPLVMAVLSAFLGVGLAWILWAVLADLSERQVRRDSLAWLAEATPEQRRTGLPTPYHAVWARKPGGRLLAPALMLLAVGGGLAVIVAFFFLGEDDVGVVLGLSVLILGAAAVVGGIIGFVARSRAARRRVEWLVAVAGERVTGPAAVDDGVSSVDR